MLLRQLKMVSYLLCGTGSGVVDFTNHTRVKHSRGGIQRIDSRVNTQFGNLIIGKGEKEGEWDVRIMMEYSGSDWWR